MTLTPLAERLAVELSLSVLTIEDCHGHDSNTKPSTCEANALTNCAVAAANQIIKRVTYIGQILFSAKIDHVLQLLE